MKACFLAMLSLLIASPFIAQPSAQFPYTEEQVITYAKSIDVRSLDPSLPSQRLEDWLQSGPPHTQVLRWWVTCDLKEPEFLGSPLCVRIEFSRNGEWGYFLIQVGTLPKGIVAPPKLYAGINLMGEDSWDTMGYAERLSDLPTLLDHPNRLITSEVRKLYEEVVAYHSIGIPAGAVKAVIWPLLSKRLTRQLETVQACQDDYARQHPIADGTPKPTWLTTDIFYGDGNGFLPNYSHASHREPQKDGSFLVFVNLAHTPDRTSASDHTWWVAARVIDEDGRYVVDDVRIFDSFLPGSPSHLLSESFAGCDGSHWTGVVATKE
jgi:hypothetical protein